MSYFSDLDLRLRADGIAPERLPLVACARCRQTQQIVGYAGGQILYGCRTTACARRQPRITSVVVIQATCSRCGDPGEHALAELSNGDQIVTCSTCDAITVLEAL